MLPESNGAGQASYSDSRCSKPRNAPSTGPGERRLFPSRRTPLSALDGVSVGSKGNILPLDYHLHHDFKGEDDKDDLSDGGSSGSSGTVKISALSSLELSDSYMNWNDCAGLRCSYPLSQPLTGHYNNATHHTLPRTPYPPSVVSNARNEANSTPSLYPNKVTRKVRWNSRAEIYNPEINTGFQTTRSLPDLRGAAHMTGQDTGNIAGNSAENAAKTSPRVADHAPLNDTIHRIETWDTSMKLCIAITRSEKGAVEIHHHAQLAVTIHGQDTLATRISICLLIINGVRRNRTCNLDRGQFSLFLDDEGPLSSPNNHESEITIIRDICDAEEPLDIYILSTHPPEDPCSVALIPTFRPINGRVLSESVFVAEPSPPLVVRTLSRDNLSTWKSSQHALNRVMHFERLQMPSLYPERLKDDLRIKIVETSPVHFPSIDHLISADIVWDLEIKVERILRLNLECRMSLWLEVGVANTLLTMDSHGWVPHFFLVDKHPATVAGGEWRIEEDRIILFKQINMLPGPIQIEMNWYEPADVHYANRYGVCQILLPRILDHEVLSGSFRCGNVGTASFNNPGVKDHFFVCDEGTEIRLPTLHKGYSLHLSRGPSRPQSHFPSVADVVEVVTTAELESDGHPESRIGNHQEVTEGPHSGAFTISHPPVPHLILQVILGWMLIIGLLWGLECARQRNENGILGDSNLTTVNEAGSLRHVDVGLGLEDPMTERAPDAHQYQEGEEGWRDWVDSTLGWKGYTP